MAAELIHFPKAKKRGAKVRKGPLCDFHDISPVRTAERRVGVNSEVVARLAAKIREAIVANEGVGAMLRDKWAEQAQITRARYDKWRRRELISAAEYAAGTLYASATDHFGEGPDEFRWARADAAEEPRAAPLERDQALACAIDCINQLAHAVRFGALGHTGHTVLRPGYDQEEADAYAHGVVASLGRTVALLKEFGAGADPA